jgi:lipopolysaccharide assembly outer membrane protein LptD (OstA)
MSTILANARNMAKTEPILTYALPDSAKSSKIKKDSMLSDTLRAKNDSLFSIADTTLRSVVDTVSVKEDESEIKDKILYQAEDSIVYDIDNKKMYLFTKASMKYQKTELEADSVHFDWNTFTLYANGKPDSTGEKTGKPVFKESDKEYKAGRMAYNFKTKRGKVYEVFTQEGEAYLQSQAVKRNENEEWYGLSNKYTTCDLEHPHYYFRAKKIKLVPNKLIVTGPANLCVGDIPTPLYIPFGIFPVKQGRRSGLIFPQFGEDARNGFFLKQGGYYFAINNNLSLKLLADVYTNGTFGVYPTLSYTKMYKFNGSVGFAYIRTMPADPDLPHQKAQNDIRFSWLFSLDQKAAPTNTFSASVNFLTSSFNKAQRTTDNSIFQTSFTSNVNYQKTFPRIPFLSLTLSLNHYQNIAVKQFMVSFPVLRLNVLRVTPFKAKVSTGKLKWYESIGISYNFEAKNVLNTYDSILFTSESLKRLRFGIQQNLNIDAPFTVAKYLNITPAFRYTERWYFQSVNKRWQEQGVIVHRADGSTYEIPYLGSRLVTDTTIGFHGVRDFDVNVTMSTKVIGIYNFKSKWVKGLRHIFSPSVSGVYHPDFGSSYWGYYQTVQNDLMNQNPLTYSHYDIVNSLYGIPSSGMVGALNFSLANNFEMKVFSKKDTVKHERKIAPLERINISGGYNFAAKTNKLSVFSINGNMKIWENFGGSFNVFLDPYALDSLGKRTDKFQWTERKQLLRFQTGNISLNATFQGKSKATPQKTDKGFKKGDYVSYDPYLFYDFNIPWRITASYTFNISSSKTRDLRDTLITTQSLYIDGDVNLTPKWKVALSSGFDFRLKQPTLTTLRVMRDLHCWELNFNWTAFPVAYQQFMIELRVKSSMLKDLKLTRRKSYLDNAF